MAYAWLTLAGMRAEDRGIARTYVASGTHRRVLALRKTGLLVFQKKKEVTLRILAGYLAPLLYTGEDCEPAAA